MCGSATSQGKSVNPLQRLTLLGLRYTQCQYLRVKATPRIASAEKQVKQRALIAILKQNIETVNACKNSL